MLRRLLQGAALAAAGDEREIDHRTRRLGKVTRARQDLLLAPQAYTSGKLIGSASATSLGGVSFTPGRDWLHLGDGGLMAVTVPR
ncbi:hypothetical protein KCH_37110 [Kitasatospora cheerisanensis KCTC 2395]|uniref:Uncharacterized protein n=1 Tax=Kitasatospora cheerisanensis KCTC 2395 TaxID=1348663 RepID=A0A066YXA7_9ACTN|nr:hypothetical protein KCH_37110 [Kitasatospora cheerisanensis KCTC 2395]